MSEKNKSNEIRIIRIYDAPVKTVWEAWTDPKKVGNWWGPRGYTITTHSRDFKAGGSWAYTMHGPDGVDYANKSHYFEVEPYSRMVYDHGGNNEKKPLFKVTALFKDLKGKTQLDMTMGFSTPEAAETSRGFIKKAGGDATWDRLAEYLAKETSGKETFVINRSFNTPINRMFELWTDPKLFAKWLPPTGFSMELIKSNIVPGGTLFYVMSGGDDVKMYGRAQYKEIEKPKRLVYTQQFCDKDEKVSRHPMAATWPETMLTVVNFTEEGPNQTRVTVTWEPYGTTTPEELKTFISARPGMTQGWTGSFDKLDNFLSS